MAPLDYSEIVERKIIIHEGQPYEVLTSHVFRKQARKPVNATKIRNLITGKTTEVSFHHTDRIEEADIEYKDAKFLYKNKGQFWFADPKDPSNRFEIDEDIIGTPAQFMKANSLVETMIFNDKVIGVHLPIKVELKVTEAPPATKGDTSGGAQKQITLETGAVVNAPLFIMEGEIVVVNTENGQYVERAKKA
jgi:elongation factor P